MAPGATSPPSVPRKTEAAPVRIQWAIIVVVILCVLGPAIAIFGTVPRWHRLEILATVARETPSDTASVTLKGRVFDDGLPVPLAVVSTVITDDRGNR